MKRIVTEQMKYKKMVVECVNHHFFVSEEA